MSKKSLLKGKAGEREFCKELSKLVGISVLTRNLEQPRSGGHDLKMKGVEIDKEHAFVRRLDEFSIEIKRYKTCCHSDISSWWRQASDQANRIGKNPMLAYRLDHQSWKCLVHIGNFETTDVRGCITMEIELFADLLRNGFEYALSSE